MAWDGVAHGPIVDRAATTNLPGRILPPGRLVVGQFASRLGQATLAIAEHSSARRCVAASPRFYIYNYALPIAYCIIGMRRQARSYVRPQRGLTASLLARIEARGLIDLFRCHAPCLVAHYGIDVAVALATRTCLELTLEIGEGLTLSQAPPGLVSGLPGQEPHRAILRLGMPVATMEGASATRSELVGVLRGR